MEQVKAITKGKPLDAGDIETLDQAKAEIRAMREMISKIGDLSAGAASSTKDPERNSELTSDRNGAAPGAPTRGRAAICASVQKVAPYEHVVIPKPEATAQLILTAIEQSVLFKNCGKEDFSMLVEAFAPVSYPKGTQVITQNEKGDDFYVVEEGVLQCFVTFPGEKEEVEVRAPYVKGESFGELALMYNNPRAATLRAAEDCKLWSIQRSTVRSILTSIRGKMVASKIEMLGNVYIGEDSLKSKLSTSDIEQLVDALEEEEYADGQCIVREGEIGHFFYIVQSGEISVHKRGGEGGDGRGEGGGGEGSSEGIGPQVSTLKPGSYFGERALLSDETRKATCVAIGRTVCLSLGREDFAAALGPLEDIMSKAAGIQKPAEFAPSAGCGNHHIDTSPEDLEVIRSLGEGAFGNVKLVLHKPTGMAFALKCQGKQAIVDNELQDHIMDERRLLMEMDHPFILKLHDSFQDDRYIYFVLEALMGGEIFTHLRRLGMFEEAHTKFYAATVLCALQHMHDRCIAYRDLKPENLVLDDKGYLKIVDLGLAKIIPSGYTWTICGTPDYLAPEIILNEGHDQAGVLIYEMMAGVAPFYASDPMTTYENILSRKVEPPPSFSKAAKDIVRKLLKINKSKRLGKAAGGAGSVMKHKWYAGFDWEGLLKKQLEVPIEPQLVDPFDASNFNPPGPDREESAKTYLKKVSNCEDVVAARWPRSGANISFSDVELVIDGSIDCSRVGVQTIGFASDAVVYSEGPLNTRDVVWLVVGDHRVTIVAPSVHMSRSEENKYFPLIHGFGSVEMKVGDGHLPVRPARSPAMEEFRLLEDLEDGPVQLSSDGIISCERHAMYAAATEDSPADGEAGASTDLRPGRTGIDADATMPPSASTPAVAPDGNDGGMSPSPSSHRGNGDGHVDTAEPAEKDSYSTGASDIGSNGPSGQGQPDATCANASATSGGGGSSGNDGGNGKPITDDDDGGGPSDDGHSSGGDGKPITDDGDGKPTTDEDDRGPNDDVHFSSGDGKPITDDCGDGKPTTDSNDGGPNDDGHLNSGDGEPITDDDDGGGPRDDGHSSGGDGKSTTDDDDVNGRNDEGHFSGGGKPITDDGGGGGRSDDGHSSGGGGGGTDDHFSGGGSDSNNFGGGESGSTGDDYPRGLFPDNLEPHSGRSLKPGETMTGALLSASGRSAAYVDHKTGSVVVATTHVVSGTDIPEILTADVLRPNLRKFARLQQLQRQNEEDTLEAVKKGVAKRTLKELAHHCWFLIKGGLLDRGAKEHVRRHAGEADMTISDKGILNHGEQHVTRVDRQVQ
eukprot:g10487.t1